MPWEGGERPSAPSLPPLPPASAFCKVRYGLSLSSSLTLRSFCYLLPYLLSLERCDHPWGDPRSCTFLAAVSSCWSGHLGSDLPSLLPVRVACPSASRSLSCPPVKWSHVPAAPGRRGGQLVCRRGVSAPAWAGVGPRAECRPGRTLQQRPGWCLQLLGADLGRGPAACVRPSSGRPHPCWNAPHTLPEARERRAGPGRACTPTEPGASCSEQCLPDREIAPWSYKAIVELSS